MSLARQQHEVPRFYLEGFACKHSGRVDAFDIREQKSFVDIPLNLSRVRDSYVFTRPDGTRDHSVDQMLGSLENDVSKPSADGSVFSKVVSGRKLTEDERAIFASFVASMYVRSPFLRRQAAEFKASIIGKFNREAALDDDKWAARIAEVEGLEDFDPVTAARARQTLIDQNYDLEMPREGTLITVNGMPEYAKLVTAMRWSIVRASRGDFITCDSPLSHLTSRYAPSGYVDIRERQSTLSFPLTSAVCWVGHWNSRRPPIVRACANQIRLFNLLRVVNADRQIYAMPYSQNLAAMATMRGKSNQPVKFESLASPDRPGVKLVRGA
jgi:hypothetical protein